MVDKQYPEFSLTEALEAKYLEMQHKELGDIELAVHNTYKKALFPTIYAKEKNEDAKLLIKAMRELHSDVKACDTYFLSEGLIAMFGYPVPASSRELLTISKDLLSQILAFVYLSLDAGENFTTLLWTPTEVLQKTFGPEMDSERFRSLYLRLVGAHNTKLIEMCKKSTTEVGSDFIQSVESAHKGNSVTVEKKERNKEIAKTTGRIAARGGLVVFMHSYGLIVCIVTAVLAVVSFTLGILSYYAASKITSALFLLTTGCCGVFIWQAQVKSGENLKQFLGSFYLGMGSFYLAIGISVVRFIRAIVGG